MSAVKKARDEMQAVLANNKRILKKARAERYALLSKAKTASIQMINEAKEDSARAYKITAQAHEMIQNEKKAAENDQKSQVAQLSGKKKS